MDGYKITVSEPFDFSQHEEFRAKVDKAINSGATEVVVDLAHVSHMDSSAIGMLIFANKAMQEKGGSIRVEGACLTIYEMLCMTQMDKMFSIQTK